MTITTLIFRFGISFLLGFFGTKFLLAHGFSTGNAIALAVIASAVFNIALVHYEATRD